MTKLALTDVQTQTLKSLTTEERQEYDGLKTDAEKVAWLETLAGILADSKELEGKIETDEVAVSGGDDRDNYPIFRPGSGPLRTDSVLRARFLGTVPMFSKEPKENWPEKVVDGEKWYYNFHYRFARTDGTLFGVFDSPMLRVLRKVYTRAAAEVRELTSPVERDPVVELVYRGKIEGKDKIKEMFPHFQLQKGNAVHGFNVRLEKGARQADRYSRDIVNLLKNPLPTTRAKSSENLDTLDVAAQSWAAVEGRATAALSAPAN